MQDSEIDQVVAYLQAVIDLSHSPLFAESHPSPRTHVSIELDGSEHTTFHVPDPYVFRSALIPFRRIWLKKEPSHFGRVCNTLSKHYPEGSRWYFKYLRDHFQRSKSNDVAWKLMREGASRSHSADPILAEDVIERGLYMDLFHCDADRNASRSGADTESDAKSAELEFMFTAAVYDVAMHATVLHEAAQFCLNELQLQSRICGSEVIKRSPSG